MRGIRARGGLAARSLLNLSNDGIALGGCLFASNWRQANSSMAKTCQNNFLAGFRSSDQFC